MMGRAGLGRPRLLARVWSEAWQAGRRAAHQGAEVVAQQGPVVVDLPLQDDEQEEQPQQDVPQVAEDVVEGAGRGDTGRTVPDSGPGPLPYPRGGHSESLPCTGSPRDLAPFTERRERGLARHPT